VGSLEIYKAPRSFVQFTKTVGNQDCVLSVPCVQHVFLNLTVTVEQMLDLEVLDCSFYGMLVFIMCLYIILIESVRLMNNT